MPARTSLFSPAPGATPAPTAPACGRGGIPGAGLRVSTRLGLGGLLWLTASFLLCLSLGNATFRSQPPTGQARQVAGSRASAAASLAAEVQGQMLEHLDALVAEALPQALPQARWRLDDPPTAAGTTSEALSRENPADQENVADRENPASRQSLLTRRYQISGPCAPLRLSLLLLERLRSWPGRGPGEAAQPAQNAAQTTASAVLSHARRAAWPRPSLAWTEQGSLELRLGTLVSHVFRFPGQESALAVLARPLPRPALVLVMDDMGQSLAPARELTALPFPVTVAIWPRAPKARETAALAGQMGRDCLLHLPMEPLPRPNGTRPKPGKGALEKRMSPQALAAVLEADLRALPTVLGLNNHMGSSFTGDATASRALCASLVGSGLLVLDSVTQAASVLEREARAAGLVSLGRDVFLDNRRDTAAVLAALDAAAERARVRGHAVAIGHPYPETLSALRRWEDKAGVAVVPLRLLVWHLAQESDPAAAP